MNPLFSHDGLEEVDE